MQKPIEHILQKDMSRKEFLATIGFGIAGVMGLSSLLRILNNGKQQVVTDGYGGTAYGGQEEMGK